MNTSTLSVFSAVAAAAWSIWTWRTEQAKARSLKRDEMSAQYVNTFIVTAQELQRKLYKILEENELSYYKGRSPQTPSPAAIDLLYHLSVFFGWGIVTFRYGPYTRDSRMIGHMARINEILDTRQGFPGDAFRFTLSDRNCLGQATIRRSGDYSHGPSYVSISRIAFEAEILKEKSEFSRLFASNEISCAADAIDRAVNGESLEGRERLAAFQNELLLLLAYLEEEEGFRVSYGQRGRASITLDPALDQHLAELSFSIVHHTPGRIRLRIPEIRNCEKASLAARCLLESLSCVKHVRMNRPAASVLVEYSEELSGDELIRVLKEAWSAKPQTKTELKTISAAI